MKPVLTSSSKTRRANFILRSYSFTPRALICPESLSVCPTSRITMMSLLALNMQVAEASVATHEMPITTAAKEVAIRQATAFPFFGIRVPRENPTLSPGSGEPRRLSAAANRRRTDRRRFPFSCTVMSPVLALLGLAARVVRTSEPPTSVPARAGPSARDRRTPRSCSEETAAADHLASPRSARRRTAE